MLIVRGDAQTLPSELNKAATGEVWFDPILPKTDAVDVGTVMFLRTGADAHDATIAAQARPEGGLRVWVSFLCQPPDVTRAVEPCLLQET
jgi:hypothetical protein